MMNIVVIGMIMMMDRSPIIIITIISNVPKIGGPPKAGALCSDPISGLFWPVRHHR